ncbi:GlsB/YeaQ/YmgE family stress response membrane protein [Membranihabitans marinus]|uniref:GlsB/YeaQ/YmgE family stress response membrane protein n=1 Tax=Membranihabitans marinus TaxID=1227546 RepID=UPI001F020CDD|nr:GlsB/YeaQ/YmgE family stress response membrane protein [Membranihabitans marinus]
MSWLVWIIFGLVVGAIAKFIHPGKDPGGWIVSIIIGILGAVVGGWIGTFLGFGDVDGFNLKSIILAVGGAVLLLFVYNKVKK